MKKVKRLLGLMLALALALSLMPAVYAAGGAASVTVDGVTTEYDALQDAITAAQSSGGTVKLLANSTSSVTVSSGTLTLDLNGCTWSANPALTVSGGEVTLVDTVGTGVISYSGFIADVVKVTGGTLNVDGAAFNVTGTMCRCINMTSGTVNIISGVIDGSPSVQMSDGSLYISGGELISGDNALYITGGTAEISGGWLHGDMGNGNPICMTAGNVTVTGGTLGCDQECGYVVDHTGGTLIIQGGTVYMHSSSDAFRKYSDNGSIQISRCEFPNGVWYSAGYQVTVQTDLSTLLAEGSGFYDDVGAAVTLNTGTKKITQAVVVSAGVPEAKTYTITLDLTGLSSSNTAQQITAGETYTTTLTPQQEGYAVPAGVTVKIGGADAGYTYTVQSDGESTLTIDGSKVKGDISIAAAAREILTCIVAGDADLCGTDWDADPDTSPDNVMSGSTVFTKTFSNVAVRDDYQLKVVTYGASGEKESAVVTFDVNTVCDVTVTYSSETGVVSVTGSGVGCAHRSHDLDGICSKCGESVGHTYVDGVCACGAVEPTVRVVYYDNTDTKWSTVNVYFWSAADTNMTTWPGEKMTLVDGESSIYYYELPVDAEKVIFNNGSTQSADLPLPEETTGLNMYNYSTGEWSVYAPAPAAKFSLYGSNMVLGSDLDMNFFFDQSNISGTDGYVVITHHDAEEGTKTYTINYADWGTYESYYMVTLDALAARQMADTIEVVVCSGDGTQISEVWTDSVRAYALRSFASESQTNEGKTLLVDMLNYGAAAQEFFGYNTSDLANSTLTDAQKACATATVSVSDERVEGDNYVGSSLVLKNRIMLTVLFDNATTDMYAIVSYTDHTGEAVSIRVEGSEFVSYSGYYGVMIDELVVADGGQLVTVTVYNADGTVFGTAADSMNSYAARNLDGDSIYEMVAKFTTSAYAYFH